MTDHMLRCATLRPTAIPVFVIVLVVLVFWNQMSSLFFRRHVSLVKLTAAAILVVSPMILCSFARGGWCNMPCAAYLGAMDHLLRPGVVLLSVVLGLVER